MLASPGKHEFFTSDQQKYVAVLLSKDAPEHSANM
jgi:hypothetical protein